MFDSTERYPAIPKQPVRLGADRIEVDDQALKPEAKVYLMLNKPRGAVTTASDEKGRDTVYAYLPAGLPWVAPVGRLDKASEGLLLLTNDSEWAARISAPATHLDKTYHVQVGGAWREGLVNALKAGVRAKDGELLHARSAQVLRRRRAEYMAQDRARRGEEPPDSPDAGSGGHESSAPDPRVDRPAGAG